MTEKQKTHVLKSINKAQNQIAEIQTALTDYKTAVETENAETRDKALKTLCDFEVMNANFLGAKMPEIMWSDEDD